MTDQAISKEDIKAAFEEACETITDTYLTAIATAVHIAQVPEEDMPLAVEGGMTFDVQDSKGVSYETEVIVRIVRRSALDSLPPDAVKH